MDIRNSMRLVKAMIAEGQPRRHIDPAIEPWLQKARARPDLAELYLHGSRHLFDRFNQPNLAYGHLIFASKLKDWNVTEKTVLQAEYYGQHLYLLKFHYDKLFNPYSDPQAKAIMADAFAGYDQEVWDAEEKLKWGRVDYQDLHLIVPAATAAGYDAFRVYEVSISGDSYAVTRPAQVQIVDRI